MIGGNRYRKNSPDSPGFFERGSTEGQEGGVDGHVSLINFTDVRMCVSYSVKYGNKRLEDKNNSNEIIQIEVFLTELKETFFFLMFKREVVRIRQPPTPSSRRLWTLTYFATPLDSYLLRDASGLLHFYKCF